MIQSKSGQSVGLRLAIIFGLSLILMIPAILISNLVEERNWTGTEAVTEVGSKWGASQTLTGPVMTVPFKATVIEDGKPRTFIRNFYFLPESLSVTGSLAPQIRSRGIFQVTLYQADLQLKGTFRLPDVEEFGLKPDQMLWDQAFISLGISDLKGIQEQVALTLGDTTRNMNPSVLSNAYLKSGLSDHLNLTPSNPVMPFSARLMLNGSSDFFVVPSGMETVVRLESAWPSPKFDGGFLPDEKQVSDSGFTAYWKVLHLNRNFPQAWIDGDFNLEESRFGVSLKIPVDHYAKTSRTLKYAIMFIGLTFLAFFMVEISSRRRIHPVQYLLIGLGLIIFYTLLLSISEHLGFNAAYWISAGAILLLIGGYARAVLRSLRSAGLISGLLLILYLFLFVVLQLEDYALLIGSLGLFTVLATVMYATRNYDWFNPDSLREGSDSAG